MDTVWLLVSWVHAALLFLMSLKSYLGVVVKNLFLYCHSTGIDWSLHMISLWIARQHGLRKAAEATYSVWCICISYRMDEEYSL